MTQVVRVALGVCIVAGLSLGTHWCADWNAIDSCLDRGHVYDYAREACDAAALTSPVIPYSVRHSLPIRVAWVVILVAAFVAAYGLRTRHRGVSFAAVMALLIMGLAVWAVPGAGRLVLLAPVVAGAGWAFLKLRRSGTVV
jgi:hypothetical protein